MDEKKLSKITTLNRAARERIQFTLLVALLVIPVFLYFSAQAAQESLNLVFLGLITVVMVFVILFV